MDILLCSLMFFSFVLRLLLRGLLHEVCVIEDSDFGASLRQLLKITVITVIEILPIT